MPRPGDELQVKPSLLDRLLYDEQPQSASRAFHNVNQLRQAVINDLRELLNTRQEVIEILPDDFAELQRSLVSYGLPDFTTLNLRDEVDRARMCRALQHAISAFEPRLDRVRVESSGPGPNEATLGNNRQFIIRAVLQVKPIRQQDLFIAEVQPSSGTIDVKAS